MRPDPPEPLRIRLRTDRAPGPVTCPVCGAEHRPEPPAPPAVARAVATGRETVDVLATCPASGDAYRMEARLPDRAPAPVPSARRDPGLGPA